jgi:hypothetical protein
LSATSTASGLDRRPAVRRPDGATVLGSRKPEGTAGALYDLFAFFVNCYHLCDWIQQDSDVPQRVSDEVRPYVLTSDVLKICVDLANRSKHSALAKPAKTGDKSTRPSSNDATIMVGQGEARHAFRVSSGEAEWDALDLALACVATWRIFLEQHDLRALDPTD